MGLRSGGQCRPRDQIDEKCYVGTACDVADISDAPIKRTAVERQVNMQILYLFILLIILSLVSTVGNSIRSVSWRSDPTDDSGYMMRTLGTWP